MFVLDWLYGILPSLGLDKSGNTTLLHMLMLKVQVTMESVLIALFFTIDSLLILASVLAALTMEGI